MIDSTKASAFKASTDLIIKKIEQNDNVAELLSDTKVKSYTIENGIATPTIEMNGELPDSGKIEINDLGQIKLLLKNNKFCSVKSYSDNEVAIYDNDSELCVFPPYPLNCTYPGALSDNITYTSGQYIYTYSSKLSILNSTTTMDGWKVTLTDNAKASTSPATSDLCVSINNKPVVSMAYMFSHSKTTSIDFKSFDTSNVVDMTNMFEYSSIPALNLSKFNTNNVKSMLGMFRYSEATSINLESFRTSNVKDMGEMFSNSKVKSLNLTKFDTSKVTNMVSMFDSTKGLSELDLSSFTTPLLFNYDMNMMCMFSGTSATRGYAKTAEDIEKFNNSDDKPSTLIFELK